MFCAEDGSETRERARYMTLAVVFEAVVESDKDLSALTPEPTLCIRFRRIHWRTTAETPLSEYLSSNPAGPAAGGGGAW